MRIHSLFTKIFLWFWMANVLVVATLVITVKMFPYGGGTRIPGIERSLELQCRGALAVREQQGEAAFLYYLERMTELGQIRVYWLEADGREVHGQSVPPALLDLAQRNRASAHENVLFTEGAPPRFAVIALKDSRGRTHQAFVDCTNFGPSLRELTDPRFMPLFVFVVIAAAGAVCYLLARHLTSPMRRLQGAVRRLATGDFSARVGRVSTTRRDEIGELGREFDRMAGQLETLLATHKQLLQDISHELRSPLSRLNVALALARESETPGPARELERMQQESDRLNELIGQILMLSRLQSGTVQVPNTTIDLTALIADICADADFEARRTGRRVQMVRAMPTTIHGATGLVRSAIENVVRNAVRYTAEQSIVEVTLGRADRTSSSGALIQVRDHGPGIPEDRLADIFRPFYRIGEGRERETGGTGLGLSITHRAILLHGGTVRAINVPTGGLMIEIMLPLPERSPFAAPA